VGAHGPRALGAGPAHQGRCRAPGWLLLLLLGLENGGREAEGNGINDPVMRGQLVKSGEGGGATPNPLLYVARGALRDMIRYGSEFGFSPASRARLATGDDPRPRKFTGLLAG
jgi:Phage terminase, small subunit